MTPSKPLTDALVKNLSPVPGKQIEVWDGKIPGFGIRVSPQGTKSFVVVYRHEGGPRRLTLGRYPIIGLADSRKLANAALRSVSLGIDPGAAKKASRHRQGDTFSELVGSYIANYAKPQNRSWSETERLLSREFVPLWGKQRAADISKRDVTDARALQLGCRAECD